MQRQAIGKFYIGGKKEGPGMIYFAVVLGKLEVGLLGRRAFYVTG